MGRPSIVVTDDDALVAEAITRDLRDRFGADHRVVRTTSGAEALDVVARLTLRDEPVALLVTDQRMPQLTGVEHCQHAPAGVQPVRASAVFSVPDGHCLFILVHA